MNYGWSQLNGRLAMAAAFSLLAAGVQARAGSVEVTALYQGDWPSDTVRVTSSYLPAEDNNALFYAGASNFFVANPMTQVIASSTGNVNVTDSYVRSHLLIPNTGGGYNFVGYCIDLSHMILGNTTHTWHVAYLKDVTANGHGITPGQASAIQYLWDTHARVATQTSAGAAAFQMAIWSLVYDFDTLKDGQRVNDPSGVNFTGNASEISTAAGWANEAWSLRNAPSILALPVYALISDDTQNFSITIAGAVPAANPVPLPVPLPESAGVGFGILGGCGLAAGLRKRLRRRLRNA